MTMTYDGTNGITFPDNSTQATAATGFGFKNRIINGAMMIDQRNAGASVTPTNGQYTLDRWFALISQSSKFTVQQNAGSVTPPAGFTNYLGCTSSSAYSVGSSEYFIMYQYIEGFNTADLGWGTANAKTVTLSFQVYSSLTGTFGGSILNNNNNRSYPFTYTVSSANTWTPVSITIVGDTTGTWETTNNTGIKIGFGLGAGSTVSGTAGSWSGSVYRSATGATSVVGTNGATFYITGVQLEKGSTATSFDYRPYGTELALCQRYYYKVSSGSLSGTPFSPIGCESTTNAYGYFQFPTTMRTAPSMGTTGTASDYEIRVWAGSAVTLNAVPTISTSSASGSTGQINCTVSSGLSASYGGVLRSATTSAYLGFSAEL